MTPLPLDRLYKKGGNIAVREDRFQSVQISKRDLVGPQQFAKFFAEYLSAVQGECA